MVRQTVPGRNYYVSKQMLCYNYVYSVNRWPLLCRAEFGDGIAKKKGCILSAVIRSRILVWTITSLSPGIFCVIPDFLVGDM